jgi:peptidoglycan/xylan/chitin deacetylase (PgdA/CDA1 family)
LHAFASFLFSCLILGLLVSSFPARGQEAVALTFDDLPVHGPLPPGMTRLEVERSIVGALNAAHAPKVYGFVNAKALEADPGTLQVLKEWKVAGFPLGNHTYSHPNLNQLSVEAYEKEIADGEPVLRQVMGNEDWHWFRYPFLAEGDTPEKRRAIRDYLKQHGYRVAEVTLSFADYDYNDPYARCMAKGDTQSIELLKTIYLEAAADSLAFGQQEALLAYGRPVKHVMLFHIGAFETVMLTHLLDLLQQKGFRLVTLAEAESDPAYDADPELTLKYGGSPLVRAIAAKHLPFPTHPEGQTAARLEALCR